DPRRPRAERRYAGAIAVEAVRGPVAGRREVVFAIAGAGTVADEELAARLPPELVAPPRRSGRRRRDDPPRIADDPIRHAERAVRALDRGVDPLDGRARRSGMTAKRVRRHGADCKRSQAA